MWRDRTIGKIINKAAEEHGLDPKELGDLYEAYFKYVTECMASDEFPSIEVLGLCTFHASPKRLTNASKAAMLEANLSPKIIKMGEAAQRRRLEVLNKKRKK